MSSSPNCSRASTPSPPTTQHMGPANEQGARDRPFAADVADADELRRRIEAGEWVVDLRQRRLWAAEHLAEASASTPRATRSPTWAG